MLVKEIMTQGVEKISGNSTVSEAMKRMMGLHITSLVVEKESEDDAYGIITRKDVINQVVAAEKNPAEVSVRDIMNKPLLTVHLEDDVFDVAKLMARTNIRRFPVHDGHDIVGMISNSDIFRAEALEFGITKK